MRPAGESLADSIPGWPHFAAAVSVTAAVAGLGLLTIPYGSTQLPAYPAFLPAFGTATFFADLMTTALLFSQAWATKDRGTADLAAAYLFSALTIIPHLMAFPGVFAPTSLIGSSPSAVWLWCVWHAGFALFVLRFACRPAGRDLRAIGPIIGGTVLIVVASSILATAGLPLLPTILVEQSYARLNTIGIGPAVVLVNLAALLTVIFRLRARSVLALWLAVAMAVSTLDSLLTLFGGGRFTLGWYMARCLSVLTGLVVLVVLVSELMALYRRTIAANRALELLSSIDPLTGIKNRRAFDTALTAFWRQAQREELPVSLLLLDVDQFKAFNDRYGHPAGDACLIQVARAVEAEGRRGTDIVARIGGEEFAVLLPNTEVAGAGTVASAIHARLAASAILHEGSPFGQVTVSIGISNVPMAIGEAAALVQAADDALYAAKLAGRNRSALGIGRGRDAPDAPPFAAPPFAAPLMAADTVPVRPG